MVADDHPLYRQGLVETIGRRPDMDIVGEADTGTSALQQIRKLKPNVAVIDMKMPGEGGMHVMRQIARDDLPTRVLFLSGYIQGGTVYEAVQAGARGYISKDRDAEAICEAIAAVAEGQMVLGAEVQEAIAEEIRLRPDEEASPLSQR